MAFKNQTHSTICFGQLCRQATPAPQDDTLRLVYVDKTTPEDDVPPRMMHAHPDFLEIVLIVSGEGRFFVHDRICKVQHGDLLIYNAGVVHDEGVGKNAGIGSYCIAVSGVHLDGLGQNMLIPKEYGQLFHCREEFEELRLIFEILYCNLSQRKAQAGIVCDHLMRVVLGKAQAIAGQQCPQEVQTTQAGTYALGMQAKAYIDAHFRETIALRNISDAVNVSSYYLSHLFKQVIGYSPIQYLLRRRIGEAQTLLIMTRLSIQQISEQVGYDTQNYFNLQFTRYNGISPGRYRMCYAAEKESTERKKSSGVRCGMTQWAESKVCCRVNAYL